MKLIEFLIHVLGAQAQTLQRLAAFFGEDVFLQILELAGETQETHPIPEIPSTWFEKILATESTSPYTKLEGTVREFKLPSVLEFHLWAYPFYRSIIESPLNLNLKLKKAPHEGTESLVHEAVTQAQKWMRNLPVPDEMRPQMEQAGLIPWIKFRSQVLKEAGIRPVFSIQRD